MVGKIVTDDGIHELPRLLAGVGTAMGWIAVGTGTTDPTRSDKTLEAEIARKPTLFSFDDDGQAIFESSFAPGELGDAVITELGLLNQEIGGKLYYRETRNPLSFDQTVGAKFRVKTSFARGAA